MNPNKDIPIQVIQTNGSLHVFSYIYVCVCIYIGVFGFVFVFIFTSWSYPGRKYTVLEICLTILLGSTGKEIVI